MTAEVITGSEMRNKRAGLYSLLQVSNTSGYRETRVEPQRLKRHWHEPVNIDQVALLPLSVRFLDQPVKAVIQSDGPTLI
jgi:hypothetical protein